MRKIIRNSIATLVLLFSTSSFALVPESIIMDYIKSKVVSFVSEKSIDPKVAKSIGDHKVTITQLKLDSPTDNFWDKMSAKVGGFLAGGIEVNAHRVLVNIRDEKTQVSYKLWLDCATSSDAQVVRSKKFVENTEFIGGDKSINKLFRDNPNTVKKVDVAIMIYPNETTGKFLNLVED